MDVVYYPPDFTPHLIWKGAKLGTPIGKQVMFDPQSIPEPMKVTHFTASLPRQAKQLQYALEQPGNGLVKKERSNIGIANPQAKPTWLNTPAYEAFVTLRAYPLQQMRKLLCYLHDDTLPLGQSQVHTLVRQVIYHIGEIKANPIGVGVHLEWKRDMAESGGFEVLASEIRRIMEEIRDAPQRYMELLLLGEISSYFAAFDNPLICSFWGGLAPTSSSSPNAHHMNSRHLAMIAIEWADALDVELKEADSRQLQQTSLLTQHLSSQIHAMQ